MSKIKLLSVMLAMILLCGACQPAIGEAPPEIAGKWMLSGAIHDGVQYTLEELRGFDIETVRSINFINAQQVVLAVGQEEDSLVGATQYTFDGRMVDIPDAGMTLELDGDRLLYVSGDVVQIFTRMRQPEQ